MDIFKKSFIILLISLGACQLLGMECGDTNSEDENIEKITADKSVPSLLELCSLVVFDKNLLIAENIKTIPRIPEG